eukprot:scaffold918_cov126-Cylindrotheca_fusiformis.AAC.43
MISGLRTVARSTPKLLISRVPPPIRRNVVVNVSPSSAHARTSLLLETQHQYRWFSDEKKKEQKKEEEAPAADATASEETAAAEEESPEAATAAEEISKEEALQIEVQSLKDQLLRSLAEQENTRTIARKDIEAARNFAIKSFAKSLLEVSDNLNRALESVDPEELKSNQHLSNLYERIQMTNDGLLKAFSSNGVVKFCDAPGDVFDPEMMNALMEYPDPSKTPGTVGQVIKAGFTLNNRVLRPAEVGVVKKP